MQAKKISLYGLTMIAIGATIGSGIFITPAETIALSKNYWLALLPWVIGGIASYCGAMTFAELGARYPKAGGVYVYLKEAYGDITGFLYGWITLFIVNTGAIAALGLTFADYLSFFIDLTPLTKNLIAVATILILSLINILGVNYSEGMANFFTTTKVAAMVIIIAIGFYFGFQLSDNFTQGIAQPMSEQPWSAVSLAFVGVFWSFGGWYHVSFVSEEADQPEKNIPKALLYSIITITLVYLLIILAYMFMLPYDKIITSPRLAGDAMANVVPFGGKLVAIFIIISVVGTIAIYTMSAPRIYFAMARDKIFFNFLSAIHPRFNTPANSILLQAVWAIALVLLYQSFLKVITFVTFMDMVSMALAVLALFKLRRANPNHTGLKIPLWQPIVFLAVTAAFVIHELLQLREEVIAGLVILALGFVIYYGKFRRK